MMTYTETELTEALTEAQRQGNNAVADECRNRLAKLKLGITADTGKGRMPMMDAYLARCIARCRPKGGQ